MKGPLILAIDQGTSSTKTIVVDAEGKIVARASKPLVTMYKDNGFVEQEPDAIYQSVVESLRDCFSDLTKNGGDPAAIKSCGISNQRETFVVWDKSGTPLYNAVVWQCKRSISICQELKERQLDQMISQKTGLLIDPYFSGTKLIWLYRNVEAVRSAVDRGEAYFGTVDTYLLYRFTNGKRYTTDHTNASRTMFLNLSTLSWDRELLEHFGLSKLNLPTCQPSGSNFGETNFGLLERSIAVTAMIGDSHAAAFGEGCYDVGSAKATMGTGCSVLMNTGQHIRYSDKGMVTTICYSYGAKTVYALEGVIVTCGATIEWLKNNLGVIADSKETEEIANKLADSQGVYFIPAFSGLGAPHWQMERKASITGLTFDSNKHHIVRAALESIPYQIKDVITAMEKDSSITLEKLMVDGGMTSNGFVMQFLADLIGKPVVNIGTADVSALGAAYLSGLASGVFGGIDRLKQLHRENKSFNERKNNKALEHYRGWQKAIQQNL
jgi:glycerol kinase